MDLTWEENPERNSLVPRAAWLAVFSETHPETQKFSETPGLTSLDPTAVWGETTKVPFLIFFFFKFFLLNLPLFDFFGEEGKKTQQT